MEKNKRLEFCGSSFMAFVPFIIFIVITISLSVFSAADTSMMIGAAFTAVAFIFAAILYEKGTSIYLAPNTNDNPEWFDTIRHIAIEGHCYVIHVDQYVKRESYPKDLNAQDEINKLPETIMKGGSCVVDLYGHFVAEPVWEQEKIIYAELDMEAVPSSRMEFDGVGHYSRPEVLFHQ